MTEALSKKLQELPKHPGVYLFKDAQGTLLYVGKAVNLRNRVRSYFRGKNSPARRVLGTPSLPKRGWGEAPGELSPRIQLMVSQIADLDYMVTDNEVESLVQENNFIKQFQPKYNVRLRDDKNYLFIKINLKDEIPTIEYDRKPTDRNARYFGPYTSSLSIKDTLRLLRRIFPYCANSKVSNKPCFYYHIGKCPGVCFGKISVEEYRQNYIGKIIKFLEGRQTEILKELQLQMKGYARSRMFEKAARVRDQIYALNRVLERQKLVYPTKVSQDVFSLYQDGVAAINLFVIREGKLIRKENFILENTKRATAEEIFSEFLPKYYLEASDWPKEILLPPVFPSPSRGGWREAPGEVVLQELTTSLSPSATSLLKGEKKTPRIITPSKGTKLDLIKLGAENARQYLEAQSDKHLLEEARLLSALKELQRVLELPELPARIEAYDISNIQGTNPVGSMVVFDFGRPKKDAYRKFKINKKQTPDDFAMMREMVERRFKNDWPKPDLILIDGGKGQLNAALSVIRNEFGIPVPVIGLAKRLEEIFVPNKKDPITLPTNSIALFLLQRVRDEAHRFAVKYHRHLRSRKSLTSVLDSLTGIGPAKKKQLLTRFGSAGKIRSASLTELAAVVGHKTAEKLKASL